MTTKFVIPVARLLGAAAVVVALSSCGGASPQSTAPAHHSGGFDSGECNRISDDDVNAAVGAGRFTKVVVSDAGCFWQENSMIGMVGAGMGISTWWYRGSSLDLERTLERQSGREVSELSLAGNNGFEASDSNACSVYVAKGADVITWSIQTINPASLPDLCTIIRRLAQLTQDRVN